MKIMFYSRVSYSKEFVIPKEKFQSINRVCSISTVDLVGGQRLRSGLRHEDTRDDIISVLSRIHEVNDGYLPMDLVHDACHYHYMSADSTFHMLGSVPDEELESDSNLSKLSNVLAIAMLRTDEEFKGFVNESIGRLWLKARNFYNELLPLIATTLNQWHHDVPSSRSKNAASVTESSILVLLARFARDIRCFYISRSHNYSYITAAFDRAIESNHVAVAVPLSLFMPLSVVIAKCSDVPNDDEITKYALDVMTRVRRCNDADDANDNDCDVNDIIVSMRNIFDKPLLIFLKSTIDRYGIMHAIDLGYTDEIHCYFHNFVWCYVQRFVQLTDRLVYQ